MIAKMVTCSVFVDNLAFGTATGKLSAITTGHSPLSAIIALLVKDQLEGDTDGTRDTFKYLKNWKIHVIALSQGCKKKGGLGVQGQLIF